MKVTLNSIQNAKEILTRLANTDLPIKTSYSLSKLIKLLNEEYNSIEECRTRLVTKYGDESDEGSIRVLPGTENFNKFIKEYADFMNTEIEINMNKIDVDINMTNMNVKPIDMVNLEQFVNFIGLPADEDETSVDKSASA